MSATPLKLAYLTAGGGGMFCGSCMHDNTLASALLQMGCDVQLIPTYTPVRTDEENVTVDQVFFGGINVFLQQRSAIFRRLPPFVDRWLNRPSVIRALTGSRIETNARFLGELTVSILRGEEGNQRKEVLRLVDWFSQHYRPDLINFSNILIAGCASTFKRQLGVPLVVTLQGDDIFLDQLRSPYREQAFAQIRQLIQHIDGFIVFSRYYRDFMAEYLGVPPERTHIVPLGLNVDGFPTNSLPGGEGDPRIGYLARICPAKGLHVLVDAFILLRKSAELSRVQLSVAGWLGPSDRKYFEEQVAKLRSAGLENDFHYAGEPDRRGKIDFLRNLDLLAVPTVYREPKGIYVLEALAAGTPVVLPEHGAFPELVEATGGGRLVKPEDPAALAEALGELLASPALRMEMALAGQKSVHQLHHALAMAQQTFEVYRKFLSNRVAH